MYLEYFKTSETFHTGNVHCAVNIEVEEKRRHHSFLLPPQTQSTAQCGAVATSLLAHSRL